MSREHSIQSVTQILLSCYQRYGVSFIKWAVFCTPSPYVFLYEFKMKDMQIGGFFKERVRGKAIERVIKEEDEGSFKYITSPAFANEPCVCVFSFFFYFSLSPQPSTVLQSSLAVCEGVEWRWGRLKECKFSLWRPPTIWAIKQNSTVQPHPYSCRKSVLKKTQFKNSLRCLRWSPDLVNLVFMVEKCP